MGIIKRNKSCAIICSVIGTFLLLFIAQKICFYYQLSQRKDESVLLLAKSEELVRQIHDSSRYLSTVHGDCGPQDDAQLKYISNKNRYLYDVGIIANNQIQCTAREGRLIPAVTLPEYTFHISSGISFYRQSLLYPGFEGDVSATVMGRLIFMTSPFFYKDRIYDKEQHLAVIYRGKNKEEVYFHLPMRAHPTGFFNETASAVSCSSKYNACIELVDAGLGLYRYGSSGFIITTLLAFLISWLLSKRILNLIAARFSLKNRLRQALIKNKITNKYQPVVDVRSGNIVGAEILARWDDEVFGKVSPEFFIPLVERLGLIKELTLSIFNIALRDLGDLTRHYDFSLSINFGSQEVSDIGFIQRLNQIVDKYGVERDCIKIEITERTDVPYQVLAEYICELHRAGYLVAIDDFGTGTSNIHLLPELGFDYVKIDKFFIKHIGDPNFKKLLQDMVTSLHMLEKRIIFEGVETEADLEHVKTLKPDARVQGWYYYRALPARELISCMLEKGRRRGSDHQ